MDREREAAESNLRVVVDNVNYFQDHILKEALDAKSLTTEQLEVMFGWARSCRDLAAANSNSNNSSDPTLLRDSLNSVLEHPLEESEKTLLLRLMSNPRLSRSVLAVALDLYEKGQGFPDADARASSADREGLRRHLLALTRLQLGDRFASNLRLMVNPGSSVAASSLQSAELLSAAALILTEDFLLSSAAERRIHHLIGAPKEQQKQEVKSCLDEILASSKGSEESLTVNAAAKSETFLSVILEVCCNVAEPNEAEVEDQEERYRSPSDLVIHVLGSFRTETNAMAIKAKNPVLSKRLQRLLTEANY